MTRKTLVEGCQLLSSVPLCPVHGAGPVVKLQKDLILTEENFFQSPSLLLGVVGSGKTSLMRQILDPVLDYIQKTGDNVVIFCAKPDMLAYRRIGDPVISITSEDINSCWNLFEEMAAAQNPQLLLREISMSLFEEAKQKTNQIFFPQSAQEIFYETARYMFDYSQRTSISFTNADLVEFLTTTPIHGDEEIPGWCELAQIQPTYFSCVRDYIGDGLEQGKGVLSELRTMIGSTLYGSFAASQGRFSAVRALECGQSRIFLHYDYANSGQSTLSVLKVILDLLLKQAMRADAKQKTFFFLDEASLLPSSDVLIDALSLGRDPGATGTGGVRIFLSLQSATLMTRHYSRKEAEMLLSLFPNVIAMRVSDSMSRQILSDRYGKAHYLYTSVGPDGVPHREQCYEPVLSDYHFSCIRQKGQAIMSLPAICDQPFFYDGFRGD